MDFSGCMFVLIALLYVNGLAENPTVVMYDFKSKATCETAGAALEKQSDETGMSKVLWQCTPK